MLKKGQGPKIKPMNKNLLLLNGAGVLVLLTVAGYYVSAMFHKEVQPTCVGQYPRAMRLGVETSAGVPLSPIELQSRAGLREWGVLDNAKVLKVTGAPAPAVIEVRLTPSSTSPEVGGAPLAGAGMTWTPPGLGGATAACLSYDVWVPSNFEFGFQGTLPGLYGGSRPDVTDAAVDGTSNFTARLAWRKAGAADAVAIMQGPGGKPARLALPALTLPKERWVHVDQEVVLNQPGAASGSYRVWVDGQLTASKMDMPWRADPALTIAGVYSDFVFRGDGVRTGTLLRVTPPVVAWR